MAKNLVSDLILAPLAQIWAQKLFLWILPLLDVRHCCKLSQYAISRKTKTSKKASFGPNLAHLTQIRAANFFFFFLKNLASSVTRYHRKLSSCTTSEKTNDPILRKLSDGQTEGQADGQTDWFHRTMSNYYRALKI